MMIDEATMMTMAVLPPDDQRGRNWAEFFLGVRVPVVDEYPRPTLLPDGTLADCYFVDFRESGPALLEHLKAVNRRRGGNVGVTSMLNSGVYPILAEGVTIVKARRGLWFS